MVYSQTIEGFFKVGFGDKLLPHGATGEWPPSRRIYTPISSLEWAIECAMDIFCRNILFEGPVVHVLH